VRAATGYNQPIARRVDSGLFALTALAGRGFTLAPLLAEHVAVLVLGRASPLARPAIRLVDCMRADSVTPTGGAASAICAARTDTGLEIPVASA